MTPGEFTASWYRCFPDILPVPYELKSEIPNRWFRIHTLPGSKRYAETSAEYDEILRRHNVILSDLIGECRTYYLISSSYDNLSDDPPRDARLEKMGLQKRYWTSHRVDMDDPDFRWYWWYDELEWFANSQNAVLRLIADDMIENVMFFQPNKKIVHHPYDGGADIILGNSQSRDFYKEKYKDWLSDHPEGL